MSRTAEEWRLFKGPVGREEFDQIISDLEAAEEDRDSALGLFEGAAYERNRAHEEMRDLRNKIAEYAMTIDNLMQERHEVERERYALLRQRDEIWRR